MTDDEDEEVCFGSETDDEFLINQLKTIRSNRFQLKMARKRRRFSLFTSEQMYVQDVIGLYLQLRERGILRWSARKIAKKVGLPFHAGEHTIGIIIRFSSYPMRDEEQLQLTRALQYVVSYCRDLNRDTVWRFMKDYGGVAGCARLFAIKSKKK